MAAAAKILQDHAVTLPGRSPPGGPAFLRAKYKVSRSRAGATEILAIRDNSLDRRRKSSTSEPGVSAATCSNLNFSVHAMTGRHTIWSIRIITATITINPQTMDPVAPALAAVCRDE